MQFKGLLQGYRQRIRRSFSTLLLVIALALAGAWYLEGTVPRHVVLAFAAEGGQDSAFVGQYARILALDGIRLEGKPTAGAAVNLDALLGPRSGIDLAIVPGGISGPGHRDGLTMLATLYYEPLWVFYRGDETLTSLSELRHMRIAAGAPESSVRSFVTPLLAANNISETNTLFDARADLDAVQALRDGEVDALLLLGSVKDRAIWDALHEPAFKLMSIDGAEAYQRHFPYITKLVLPTGAVDFAQRSPPQEVQLIGTKAMLVARDDVAFPLIQVLLDAARQIHSTQGFFEAAAEFPNTMPVDLPVSLDATRHLRFGPKMLQRYMPLVAASYLERVFILLVPLVILVIPFVELAWLMFRSLVMRRIYRLYGELKLLEREIDATTENVSTARWLAVLDRIEKDAGRMSIPDVFTNEAYVLRSHVFLVRQAILGRAESASEAPPPE